ncbi:MAG: hypothetical protein Q8R57_00975 [Bacteroidota bacterium]|nr:hypothetical protein [Bacteroidota bacterium]
MHTPVLLIIFNRFDTTQQVIAKLREAAVPKLYMYCDGPRKNKLGETELLKEVQEKVLEAIDWPCSVITQFREENEGPRLAIGHAVSWLFETEERGIILEHDCVPHLSFFNFCETLLEHYKDDERVMHISGDNFQFGKWRGDGSYYFSRFNHIWGFATWKRAWKQYDLSMSQYPMFREKERIKEIFASKRAQRIWLDILDRTYSGSLQTWDYQWTFAIWNVNGLAILPNVNLISNVGFDSLALNTTNAKHRLANMPSYELGEIKHPSKMNVDVAADNYAVNDVFNPSMFRFALQKFGII